MLRRRPTDLVLALLLAGLIAYLVVGSLSRPEDGGGAPVFHEIHEIVASLQAFLEIGPVTRAPSADRTMPRGAWLGAIAGAAAVLWAASRGWRRAQRLRHSKRS